MTACGGMSTTSTRRFTLVAWATAGILTTRPGARALVRTRPHRNITARSYSLTTRMLAGARMAATISSRKMTPRIAAPAAAASARIMDGLLSAGLPPLSHHGRPARVAQVGAGVGRWPRRPRSMTGPCRSHPAVPRPRRCRCAQTGRRPARPPRPTPASPYRRFSRWLRPVHPPLHHAADGNGNAGAAGLLGDRHPHDGRDAGQAERVRRAEVPSVAEGPGTAVVRRDPVA